VSQPSSGAPSHFQPERAALEGKTPPLVKAFVMACVASS